MTVYFLHMVLVIGNSAFLFKNNLSSKRRISLVDWKRYPNKFKLGILAYISESEFDNKLNESGERVNWSLREMLAAITLGVVQKVYMRYNRKVEHVAPYYIFVSGYIPIITLRSAT